MEQELKLWLGRFPVPTMVSSFDATEALIRFSKEAGESHLMGYVNPQSGSIVNRWGIFENDELPAGQMTADYFNEVYRRLPFTLRKDIAAKVNREQRDLRVGLRIFRAGIIFIAAIPVAIELISLGITWLAALLQSVSILAGVYKVANAAGWLKQSTRAKTAAEKQRKMDHYYYHCERNLEAFERLKIENFKRESAEMTRKEAMTLAAKAAEANKA